MRTKAPKCSLTERARVGERLGEGRGWEGRGGLPGHMKDFGLYPKSSRKPQEPVSREEHDWICDF